MDLNGIKFDNMSEEQRAKALACKTPEEMLALAREEGYELSDEQLEQVAGGWTCYCEGNCGATMI